MRVLDSEYKLKQNIRIAMLYLEDEDAVNADVYIKKASSLIAGSKVCLCVTQQISCVLHHVGCGYARC